MARSVYDPFGYRASEALTVPSPRISREMMVRDAIAAGFLSPHDPAPDAKEYRTVPLHRGLAHRLRGAFKDRPSGTGISAAEANEFLRSLPPLEPA